MRLQAILVVAVLMVTVVPAQAVGVQSEEDVTEPEIEAETADSDREITDARSTRIPEPFDRRTMVIQSLAGLSAFGATLLVAGTVGLATVLTGIAADPYTSPFALAGGMAAAAGVMALSPVMVATAVNITGNSRGYRSQYLGGYLGGVGGGLLALSLAAADDEFDRVLTGVAIGTTAGSVLGYHIQAPSRPSEHGAEAGTRLTPFIGSDDQRRSYGLGLTGRF